MLLAGGMQVVGVASIVPFMQLVAEPASIHDNAWMRWLYRVGGFESARATTRHLLALGHRRIAFVDCFNSALYNPERIAGYRAALARKGVEQSR